MKKTTKRFIVNMAYYNAKYQTFREFFDANAPMYKREIKSFSTKKTAVKFANQIKNSFKAGYPMVELNKRYKFSHMYILDSTKPMPEKYKGKGIDKYCIVWNN